MNCPYCGSINVSNPTKMAIEGLWELIRQCHDCLKIMRPDGSVYHSPNQKVKK